MACKIDALISDATDKVSSEFGIGCRSGDPMQAVSATTHNFALFYRGKIRWLGGRFESG